MSESRYQCIGYATFVERLEKDSGFARWFERLGGEIDQLSDPAPGQLGRLIELQHALIHVIDFLDPGGLRFPKGHIEPLDPPAVVRPGVNDRRALLRGARKLDSDCRVGADSRYRRARRAAVLGGQSDRCPVPGGAPERTL